MKRFFIILIITSGSIFNSLGQVEEIKKAQEKRKEYIGGDKAVKKQFTSKSIYVNPFIGTGGHGHTYPGATAPFGMIQLSPDTRHTGWDGCSGYHYSDSIIYGFSHTHLSGTGVSDYGDLLIVPQCGKPKLTPGYEDEKGYGSRFTHANEEASPGYYSVHLIEPDIDVRLTVSKRAGFHEYTFNNPSGKRFIVIDLDHRDRVLSATINLLDKFTISGSRTSEAWAREQHFFYYMKTDVAYQKARIFKKKGKNKLLLIFPKGTDKINIRVGISAADAKGAQTNLEKEIPDWNFNKTRANVVKDWDNELGKLHFQTTDKTVMTNFYTALYHSYLAPNIFSDADGRYRGRDMKIHTIDDLGDQYTVFSLWDTYRATHPLYTLMQVERTNHFVNTFLRQFDQGGDLPVWELAGNETECMIGFHSVSVIADAFSKGIRNYDIYKALNAMKATASFDEYGKKAFIEKGFIDSGSEPESVSKALEYSYDHFCISAMNNALMDDTIIHSNEQFNFINHFDPSTKFMRARRNGLWFAPFDPSEVNFNYTEANSWQYSMYAPHAVGVLTDLLGGKDSLEAWLDNLFTTDLELSGRQQADITGLIGQYAHGNEPSHHMAYLYNYTNAPYKTQSYLDQIEHEMYRNAPDGLAGNEDCGQMSSWYVLSALGIYQIAPGNPYYEIGRPLMDEAILQFSNGNELEIKIKGGNKKNKKYIDQLWLNGKELDRLYLSHNELIQGGKLEFSMSDKPSSKLFEHAPTISSIPQSFVALPYFNETIRVFEENLALSLNTPETKKHKIYYTVDGSEPTRNSAIYTTPIKITETSTIKAFTATENYQSAIIENTFVKSDNSVRLELKSSFDNQYTASGPLALIDGIKGGNEFRTGDWQGYWAQDVIADLTLVSPKKVNSVSIGCLSDMKSWVFLPESIVVQFSYDGEHFEKEEGVINILDEVESDMYPHKKNYTINIKPEQSVKKIRIIVNNSGKCPEWHLGAGNDTWLFLDEIVIN